MLAGAAFSPDAIYAEEGGVEEEDSYAVVIALGKAHDRGHTSTMYGLKICVFEDEEEYRVSGNPFRLFDSCGSYIWKNTYIRAEKLEVGSVITLEENLCRYLSNTGVKMEIDEILSQLQFGNGNHGVAFRGIREAFSQAVIASPQGIYQNGRKPNPPYALISLLGAVCKDDRICAVTRLGEQVDLNNRSRGQYKHSSVENVKLPVRKSLPTDVVGDVILVAFGNKTSFGPDYQAVCDGILIGKSREETLDELDCEVTGSYPMSRKPRGLCLIINNMCFHRNTKQKDRYGAEHDEKALMELFEQELHFEVHIRNDLQYYQMQQVSKEFGERDHSEYDAFVCIIMSHGDRDGIMGVGGLKIGVNVLTSEFNPSKCPSLASKPKVFIIQACRGPLEDEKMQCTSTATDFVAGVSTDSTISEGVCAQESDFLLAFSTVPRYVSYRDAESGSHFIQILVDIIREHHAEEHLSDMLTIVTRRVADRRGQVPNPTSTLRYKLYL